MTPRPDTRPWLDAHLDLACMALAGCCGMR